MKVEEIVDIAPREDFAESKLLHFQRLGNEFFNTNEIEKPRKLEEQIEHLIKNNIFKLPFELNEFYIDINNLGKSFLIEYYYLNESAKKSHEVRKLHFLNKQIETFFYKWADSPNFEAKLYYSRSILEKIQKDYTKIINILISAILFAEEETLLDFNESAKLFDKAISIFERMSNRTKITERILYILNIFNGLVHLKMEELDEATYYFIESMKHNRWAENAKFYLAYSYALQDDVEKTSEYLTQVYDLDQNKLNFFITTNQLKLFKFFVKNCFLTHIFEFNYFSKQFENIEQLISEKVDYGNDASRRIEQKIQGLNEKRVGKYLIASHSKDLAFVNKLMGDFKDTNNFWVLASFQTIENKLEKIIDSIIGNIKDYYKSKLENHEKLYEEKINDEKKRIEDLENSIHNSIVKIEEEIQEKKRLLENQVQNKTDLLNIEINNLEKSKNEVSIKSFSNSMVYTFMISVFVFLTGGFAEYTADFTAVDSNFSSAIAIIISHGIKWGVMAFIIGLVISAFSSISSVLRLYTKKQRLQNQLSKSESILQIGLRQLELELKERKKYATDRSMSIIKNHNKNIENLEKEKDRKISELKEEYASLSEKEIQPFLALKEII